MRLATADEDFPEYEIPSPDSGQGGWYIDTDIPNAGAFFTGSHVRHPSGMMVIWLDTATRATEDRPVGRAHVDSVVVQGLRHLEYLARICINGSDASSAYGVVGVVQEADTTAVPRVAWRLNPKTLRIEPLSDDSRRTVRCMVNEPVDEVDE